MQPDPATDSTGRLSRFLDRAIGDLKPRATEKMTDLPPTALNGPVKKDDLVASLTGASSLADALMQRIEKSKTRHIAAGAKVDAAFGKLDSASVVLEAVATKVEAEADAVLAQLGQVSNMGS